MTKTGGLQYTDRCLEQQRPLPGILQNGLSSFVSRMIICCIVFWGIITSVSGRGTGCLNKEIKSLMAFKSSLHDPVGRLVSWNVSFSCCEWEGVTCDTRIGHVVAVDLDNCSLSGVFRPAVLIELKYLGTLNVSINNFTGQPIPQQLGLLRNLRYLNLSTAGFEGSIPWQLGNLSNLIVLDLTSPVSMLRSPDLSWLTNLMALEQIYLKGINISATSPTWGQSISPLTQLRNISKKNYGLMGSIPASLQKLTSLEIVHLDGNNF